MSVNVDFDPREIVVALAAIGIPTPTEIVAEIDEADAPATMNAPECRICCSAHWSHERHKWRPVETEGESESAESVTKLNEPSRASSETSTRARVMGFYMMRTRTMIIWGRTHAMENKVWRSHASGRASMQAKGTCQWALSEPRRHVHRAKDG